MKTIEETIKDTIVESLEELRSKSISNIEVKGVEEKVEDTKLREKAVKEAFLEFVKTGEIREKAVEMSELSAEAGEVTVPLNIFDQIIKKIKEKTVMRNYARHSSISVGNEMELILDDSDFTSAWVDETTGRVATDAGKFKSVKCKVHEMWAMPVITRWLLKDSMFDLEGFIVESVANQFAKSEEEAFWYGTGDSANQPKGLLYTISADYTTIDYTNLTNAIYDLEEEYAKNGVFFLNRKTMKVIKNLVDGNNRPLFTETSDIERRYDGMLLGYPVVFTGALKENEIVFGDLYESYMIVDKSNDTGMQYDDITVKGKVQYPTWKRVGGTPVKKAYKYIKVGA